MAGYSQVALPPPLIDVVKKEMMGPLGCGIEARRALLDYAPTGIHVRPERAQQRRTLDSQPYPRNVDLQPVWRCVTELRSLTMREVCRPIDA